MSTKDDGGSIFPDGIAGIFGMSLRDYFAAQALALVLSQDGSRIAEKLAENAYAIADAMLTERAK